LKTRQRLQREPLTREKEPERTRRNLFGEQGKKEITRREEGRKANTTRFRGTSLEKIAKHYVWIANSIRSKVISPSQGQAIVAALRGLVQVKELSEYLERMETMKLLLEDIRGNTFRLPPPDVDMDYEDAQWESEFGSLDEFGKEISP